MRRALSDTIAFISFLLVITATVFWSRSYQFDHSHPGESLNFRLTDPLWWVISHRGTLTLCRQNGREWGQEFGKIEGFGFRFGGLKGPKGSLVNLGVPYWFVVGAAATPPGIWWLRRRRDWRKRCRADRGLCRRCGYDIRASPGRCSECGTAIAIPAGDPGC